MHLLPYGAPDLRCPIFIFTRKSASQSIDCGRDSLSSCVFPFSENPHHLLYPCDPLLHFAADRRKEIRDLHSNVLADLS
jgi:hypothetical protein